MVVGLSLLFGCWFNFSIPIAKLVALWLSNAFLFWILFDMIMGWHAFRDIWYIGVGGFDGFVRKVFLYDRFRGRPYFIVKLILYIIFTFGMYFDVTINDLFH